MERASWRARDLTQQLLPFSSGGKPIRKTVSLPEILKEICLSCLDGSNVRCRLDIPDGLWPAEVDVKQIRQAMSCLLANAREAMPEKGGMVLVRASNIPAGSHEARTLKTGSCVRVSVQDEGSGIAEEHLGRIFDPYFSTKKTGRGLGLAAPHTIIEQHQGSIVVESWMGVGTTFHIYLPALKGEEKRLPVGFHGERAVPKKAKILVMDDDDALREFLRKLLDRLGYATELARDGKEALDLYRRSLEAEEPFDRVILDLTVPGGMGGKETIQELAGIDPSVRAIVSSGYSNDPIMAQYQEHGFRGVLEKP